MRFFLGFSNTVNNVEDEKQMICLLITTAVFIGAKRLTIFLLSLDFSIVSIPIGVFILAIVVISVLMFVLNPYFFGFDHDLLTTTFLPFCDHVILNGRGWDKNDF